MTVVYAVMIVAPDDDRLRLVTQNDHAVFAAELLGLWRADGLPEHPRRRALLRAVREHDNGWREADSAPHRDPQSGRPYDFVGLPEAFRIEIWERGTERLVEPYPDAALLVLQHAVALHRDRDSEAMRERVAAWRERRDALAEELWRSREEWEEDYRWLALADLLSLAVSAGWTDPFDVEHPGGGVRSRVEPAGARSRLLLDPFPLAGATTLPLRCRRIPDRRYAGDADLGVELATARWDEVAVRVEPL